MALTDEEVGLAPARPRGLSDDEVGLAGPETAASFGGAPSMEPQLDPSYSAPAPTLWERAKANASEAFNGTSTGEVVNYNRSGQNAENARDQVFRAIAEARAAGSPVGLEAFQLTPQERKTQNSAASPFAGIPLEQLEGHFNQLNQTAQDKSAVYDAEKKAETEQFQAMPSFTQAPTLWGKVSQGAAALGGQLVGGAPAPENLVGGPEVGAVRGAGEGALRYAGRRILPGAVEGAAGAAIAQPIVQGGQVARGEQESFDPAEAGQAVAVGAGVGASFRMAGHLWSAFRASRKKTGQPELAPDQVHPNDVLQQLQADPEFAAIAEANGIDAHKNDPRAAVLKDKLANRRTEQSLRPEPESAPPTAAEFGTAQQPGPAQKEIARRQEEIEAVKAGTVDPAATNVRPREPDTRTIAVDSQGGAFRQDAGTDQGRIKAPILESADRKALPAPGRHTLTDEEIARQRAEIEGGQKPDVEAPPKVYGSEERAPQTSSDLEGQRQAGEAFTLADRQRQRAGEDVRDTQVAGRPEGANAQTVHLDEGHPVEILDRRMVPDAKGNMVEMATVRRYDPRTGQPAPDHVEYDVPVKQLKAGQYAAEPRMAQDFEARAETGRINAGRDTGKRMDDAQGFPHQTYITTPPDENAAGTARAARPEQPEGPHPGRRWSTYEEAMRDFEARQSRGEAEAPKGGNTYEGKKSSNQARGKDRDGRFLVDEQGHVMSSAEGPIRFADQKQAAKWILNVGQKESPDQIFEIAVHPDGKGFTARERGRSETPPPGGGEKPTDTPNTESPAAKPDTSPPRQLNGPRAEAPRSPTAEQPAGATVQTGPSFEQKIRERRDAVILEEQAAHTRKDGTPDRRGYWFKGNEQQVNKRATETARYDVMREEAADQIHEAIAAGIPEDKIEEISGHYTRLDGETPEQAFNRAADRWENEQIQRARLELDDAELRDFSDLIHEGYDEGASHEEDIPFGKDTAAGESRASGGDAPAGREGASPVGRPGDEAGSAGENAGRESGVGRETSAHAGEANAGRPNVDAGPDGRQQSVIPGAERITDREHAERRGEQPLRGGNEPPPKGGLFDEDARNQGDMFDKPKGGGSTFYSNPFFAPEAWSGLAKSLGVHAQYFRDLKASYDAMRAAWQNNSGKKTNSLADVGRTIFYSTDGELRAVGQIYKSPTIKKIADMLFAPADMGKGGAVSRTYHEAVEGRTVSNLNKLADILHPFANDTAKLNQIRQLVQNSGAIKRGTPIHDAAARLRKLLDDEFAYLKDAGVDVGQVKDYFPRIVDAEQVLRNQAGFVDAATKQYLKDGLAKNHSEAEKMAQAWLQSVELGHAGAKKDGTDFVMLGGTPNSDFRKERVFGRSIETDKNNPLARYYLQDPVDALTLHFQRTARRAEWSRRFGDDLGKWKELKQAIVGEGNVAALRQVVDAIGVSTGTQRAYQSDAARAAVGALRTWGAIKLLPRATITSLSETAMPAIRSGNLTRVLGDVVRTVQTLAGGMKGERELASDLGLISHAIGDSVLGRRYFALEPGSKVQQDIINRFFRRTGLEQLTNAQRVVAVAAGQTFLRRLAKDVDGGTREKSSAVLLRELGIEDGKGFSKWLQGLNDGMPGLADIQKDNGFAGQYRTALQRFNQQTSLAPNSSTKPKWANHPIGSLVFMLQSYSYAFQKQVLNRAGAGIKEATVGKGYNLADRATMLAPAMALPALAAIQWGLAAPRDAVFADPTAQKKTDADTFMQVASRSGLTGILDPYINMATGARYDRDAATAIAGPVLGSISQLGDAGLKLAVKNSDNTNTAERNFAKAFYDATIMPSAALLSGFLPAPVGAAAIQYAGSGSAREAFTSAVAGQKEQQGSSRPPRPARPHRPSRP